MDGHVIPEKTVRSTYVFFITYFLIFALSILLISFNGFSFETNFTAVCATLNNIGPGLDMVGPAANFSLFHPLAKVVLIFDMLAGRLELLPMLIVFYPGAWKKH
jgi:trk system potassium uptake protein TrkH